MHHKQPDKVEDHEIRDFIIKLVRHPNVSTSSVNNFISSIQFFYKHISKREFDDHLFYRPKVEESLPTVLSLEEIYEITNSIKNLKHRCLIELTYSAGLRRSETLALKIADIDFGRGVINIKQGKGKKDRTVMLADSLKMNEYGYSNPNNLMIFKHLKTDTYEAGTQN